MLRNASDKTGRSIAGAFLSLPSPRELPEYYEQIKLPMAIDTIEAKLQAGAYPTVTTVESDVKRMIQNAKDFNMPKSEIFEDAERMRKLAYNYMKVNNPAYKMDPTYSSFPTPVPLEKGKSTGQARTASEKDRHSVSEDKHLQPTNVSKRSESRSQPKLPVDHSEDAHESENGAEEGPDYDFEGKSFQEAQQIIISALLSHADSEYARHMNPTSRARANSFSSGLEIFTPFVNLPSRKLEDYYKLIKHPVSIKSVQKRTRGQHGRASPTGVSDFKTWDAFEEELSYVWKNAREYNEDGSEMYELANEFEVRGCCRLRLFLNSTDDHHRAWSNRTLQKRRKKSKSQRACASRLEHQNRSRALHSTSASTALRQRLRTVRTAKAPLSKTR
jgi:hypothetical protein